MIKRLKSKYKIIKKVYNAFTKRKKAQALRWTKSSFFTLLSRASRGKKKISKRAKPVVKVVAKHNKKAWKWLRPQMLTAHSYVKNKRTNFVNTRKVIFKNTLAFIYSSSPKLHGFINQKSNEYDKHKKSIKRHINRKTSNKASWWGKLYDVYYDLRVHAQYLNLFNKKIRVHKTPTFLQMEATECGSICFSIVLAYYKHELTAEEARSACGVSRDGSKASHIVRAARQYGMEAKGYSIHDIKMLDKCPLPTIIHWNFDHFVVYEGRIGKYYYINDPAVGRRRVDFDEFNRNFTGVVLILTPTKEFVEKSQENPVVSFLVRSLQRGVGGIAAAFFLSILQILPTLLIAFSSKVFIDYILVKNMAYWLIPLTMLLASCVVLQSFLLSLHQRLLVRLSIHFKLSLESQIVHKLFHLPLRFFDQRFSGDILYRLSSAEELSNVLSLEIMGALSNVFGLLVFTIVLTQLSFPLFLIMLAFIALRVLVFYLSRERIRETNIHYQQQFGKVTGVAMNGLDIMDTLKANNLEHVFFKNWAANHDTLLNKHQKVGLVDQRTMIWLMGLAGLMTVGLLYRGTYLVMGEQITVGTLMAFMILSAYLDAPIMTLLDFSSKIEKIKASINRFNDILLHDSQEEKAKDKRKKEKIELPKLQSDIQLKNVKFGYAPLDPPIFEDLSLTIPKGKTVAFVGISGSGKSTISKLICGLYPITEGEILWDSVPIQNVDEEQRTRRISLVDQDIYLFDGTIRDNLTSWNKDIDDQVLIETLKCVGLYQELLPRGLLNSPVSENGANLSGGQRQRLEIARALIRNADVLILDEATSSLDIPNETRIFNSINNLDITTIIIAHRLSTIQKSDIIYVINEGKVVQKGNHKTLSKQPGIYKNLVKLELAENAF
jgi:ATP-binding cassette subfamily C protein